MKYRIYHEDVHGNQPDVLVFQGAEHTFPGCLVGTYLPAFLIGSGLFVRVQQEVGNDADHAGHRRIEQNGHAKTGGVAAHGSKDARLP